MKARRGNEALQTIGKLRRKAIFQSEPRRRTIAKAAGWSGNRGERLIREVGSKIPISLFLYPAIENTKAAVYLRFRVYLIREANAWREVCPLRGQQTGSSHILDGYIVRQIG